MAARITVGMANINEKKTLNLTQLRKNSRKRVDKTYVRKAADIDMVGAGDADDDDVRILATSVLQNKRARMADTLRQRLLQRLWMAWIQQFPLSQCVTHASQRMTPPPPWKREARKMFQWIGCDKCPRWFHNVCLGITFTKGQSHFECEHCSINY